MTDKPFFVDRLNRFKYIKQCLRSIRWLESAWRDKPYLQETAALARTGLRQKLKEPILATELAVTKLVEHQYEIAKAKLVLTMEHDLFGHAGHNPDCWRCTKTSTYQGDGR